MNLHEQNMANLPIYFDQLWLTIAGPPPGTELGYPLQVYCAHPANWKR